MFRKKADDSVIYGAYGMEVKSPFPPGVLGYLQPHEYATPETLERARQIFPQADMDDYELRETGPDKFLFINKATRQEYRRDGSSPLLEPNPRSGDIVCFVVDAGNRIHYLRPNAPRPPTESVVLVTSVVGRQL